MSTATESCFTAEDVQGAGNCAIGCVEYQVLTYPQPSRLPVYEPDVYYDDATALERVISLVTEGTEAAVVEKTTTVSRRVILGPFAGVIG